MTDPDTPTPKPQAGEWTLTAPDGRQWRADSPIHCVSAEQRERVPASVALARIMREVDDEPATNKDSLTVAGGQQGEARPAREDFRRMLELLVSLQFDGIGENGPSDEPERDFDAAMVKARAALATQAAPEAPDWSKLANSLMGMLGEISDALDISEADQSTASGAEEIIDRIEELKADAFAMAAGQCVVGTGIIGDEGGTPRCPLQYPARPSGERDTLRELLREARACVRAYRGERSMRGADTIDEDALLARLDALKLDRAADGGAK